VQKLAAELRAYYSDAKREPAWRGDLPAGQLTPQTRATPYPAEAYVGPDGQANFRGDPYDWDHALMQRIDAGAHPAA